MKFRAEVYLTGKTATGIQVPDEIVEKLGTSKRPPVKVTIGEYTYRTTIAPMGGQFWIPLSSENRTGAGVSAGDTVEVGIEMDHEPREIMVPEDLMESLKKHSEASQFFDGLSYSNKRKIVLNIEGAKTAETRLRRIEKTVEQLKEGKV